MRARVHESPSRVPHEPTGIQRLLEAETALETALAEAEGEARALLSAADQRVCEHAQGLGVAIEAAVAERAAHLMRESAAEEARVVSQAAARVAAWDAVDGAELERLATLVVARVVALDDSERRGAP